MKKYLFYFFAVVCSVSLFSCGDDDDPEPNPGPGTSTEIEWEDCAATYGSDNTLVLNDETVTDGSKTVVLGKGSDGKAEITLKNVIEDIAELAFKGVEMVESSGNYTFSAAEDVEDLTVSISGTLVPGTVTKATEPTPAKLTLKYEVKSNVPEDGSIEGTWKLGTNESKTADFSIVADTDLPALNMMLPGLAGTMVGGLISQKVDEVTISFTDGIFDFNWKKKDATEVTTIIDVIVGMGMPAESLDPNMLAVKYEENKEQDLVTLLINKGVVEILTTMLGKENPQIAAYFALLPDVLEDKETDWGLTLRYALDGDNVRFYMDRDMIAPLLPILMSALEGVNLDEILGTVLPGMSVETIVQAIAGAKQFEVGLGFTK